MRIRLIAVLVCACASAAALVLVNPLEAGAADAPTPSHHRAGGFQNNYLEFEPKGLMAWLAWQWSSATKGLPHPPKAPTPTLSPDLNFIHANAKAGTAMQPSVTWIGHATVLAQLGGLNVLTDPMFSERASPLSFMGAKRHVAPGVAMGDLPHVDVVLVSHNHYDHLDEASVKALDDQPGGAPLFVVPLGLKAWMEKRGISNVVELDWWRSHRIGAVDIVLTPVQHWSARGLNDRMATLWGGFAVFAPDLHLFFAGDTSYSKDFADIRAHFADRQGESGFDVAILPIGGYEPRDFMATQHVNPTEAVQIHLDLAAWRSIGVHWGTFELTDEPMDEPPVRLAEALREKGLAEVAFTVMAVGETQRIPARASGGW